MIFEVCQLWIPVVSLSNYQLIKDSAPHSLLLYAVPSQLNQTVAVMNIITEFEVY